ncbi:MAG: deoxyribonuclease IV [Proteobacteria bacterium]|nr:deoxyribonuclease IV [Pseudomonadota bacterium]
MNSKNIIMRFGFHISIAGGFPRVIPRALRTGCETMQIFSGNPRAWKKKPFNPEEAQNFQEALSQTSIAPLFIHAPYLLNLASPSEELYTRSIDCLVDELNKAYRLGARSVIVHVGNKLRLKEPEALDRVARAINLAFRRANNSIQLLLENTAGQGTEIGFKFSQLKTIVDQVDEKERIGICLDTAHAFEAGYDLSTSTGLNQMMDEFDTLLGLDRLKALHLNDSRTSFGSRVDRHWHIGKGEIGLSGFLHIVNHPALIHLPGIMETPRKEDADDLRNMEIMRSLIR